MNLYTEYSLNPESITLIFVTKCLFLCLSPTRTFLHLFSESNQSCLQYLTPMYTNTSKSKNLTKQTVNMTFDTAHLLLTPLSDKELL